MRIVRVFVASIMVVFGALALLLGLSTFGSGVDQTIEHSRAIEKSFQSASQYVVSFREQHGHLPTAQEFEAWTNTFPSKPYNPNGMWLQVDSFPEESLNKFGAAPNGSFLLVYWRGEWAEYYASWVNQTSLEFDRKKYYLLGSELADGFTLTGIALTILIGSYKIWPNKGIKLTARNSGALREKP